MADCFLCGKFVAVGEGIKREVCTSTSTSNSSVVNISRSGSLTPGVRLGNSFLANGGRSFSVGGSLSVRESEKNNLSIKSNQRVSKGVKTICIECGLQFEIEDYEKEWAEKRSEIIKIESRIGNLNSSITLLKKEKVEIEGAGFITKFFTNAEQKRKDVIQSLSKLQSEISIQEAKLQDIKEEYDQQTYLYGRQLLPFEHFYNYYMRNAEVQAKDEKKVEIATKALEIILRNCNENLLQSVKSKIQNMIEEIVAFINRFQIGGAVKDAKYYEARGDFASAKEHYEHAYGILLSDDIPDNLQSDVISHLKAKIDELSSKNTAKPESSNHQDSSFMQNGQLEYFQNEAENLDEVEIIDSSDLIRGNTSLSSIELSLIEIMAFVVSSSGGKTQRKEKIVKAFFRDYAETKSEYKEYIKIFKEASETANEIEPAANYLRENCDLTTREYLYSLFVEISDQRGQFSQESVTMLEGIADLLDVEPVKFEDA
jgi:uncharacterized tellurite resistance protein B-like protein